MRIKFTNVLLAVFYTGYIISPVSSIWIIVPSNGVKCGANALLTNYNLANAVEPGCEKIARFEQHRLARFIPLHKFFLPELYQGPQFSGSYPLFELKIKSLHNNGIFQYPKYKAIFEWNSKQKICIPRGVIAIIKSGSQYRCDELHYPQQKYDDKFLDQSFGRHFKAQRDYELQNAKSEYPPESIFDIGKFTPPRGFFRSALSLRKDGSQEGFFKSLNEFHRNSPSSSSESSDPSVSFENESENLSSQKSPLRPQMSSPSPRQKSTLKPQRSYPTLKSLLSHQKPFSPYRHDSAQQIQRSHSTPILNMASGSRSVKKTKSKLENDPNHGSPAPFEMNLASLRSESVRSDQGLNDSSENLEPPQAIANTPLNKKGIHSIY